MTSDTDLPHQSGSIQQPRLMKEYKSHKWKYFFIILFIINLIAISPYLLFLLYVLHALPSTGAPDEGISFLLLIPYSIYIIPFFVVIDVVSILIFLIRHRPKGKGKIVAFIILAFLVNQLIGIGQLFIERSPISISREEATIQINACNISELTREPNKKIRIEFVEGKYTANTTPQKIYAVSNKDFDTLLDSARAVQGRCGYNFGLAPGIEGFRKGYKEEHKENHETRKEYHGVYITLDQAANLLNSCIIKRVVYFSDAESSFFTYNIPTGAVPTGIILWPQENPQDIYVKNEDLKLKTETLPIIHEAKRKCLNLETHGIRDL